MEDLGGRQLEPNRSAQGGERETKKAAVHGGGRTLLGARVTSCVSVGIRKCALKVKGAPFGKLGGVNAHDGQLSFGRMLTGAFIAVKLDESSENLNRGGKNPASDLQVGVEGAICPLMSGSSSLGGGSGVLTKPISAHWSWMVPLNSTEEDS